VEGEQRQAGLSLSQSLLNLPLWSQSRAGRLEARAYAEAVRAAVNEAEAAVRSAYLDLLADQALAQVYEEQERDTAAFLERAKRLLAHGLAAPLEVARAGLDLAEAKRKVIEGRASVRRRMARLAEAVGLPQIHGLPVAPWEVSAEAVTARLGELGEAGLIAQGLKNRPDLARLTLLSETAQASLEAAEAGHYPTLDLQGSLGQYGEHDLASQFHSYGLFLNLPLFTGFKLKATAQERQALLKAALEARTLTALTVRREVQEAWLGLWEAQAKLAVSASQVENAQENYRLIKGRHENGLATPLELSEARTQRFNALAAAQQARYGVFSALSELDRSLGGGVFPGLEAKP
jgi:outer membrane protein